MIEEQRDMHDRRLQGEVSTLMADHKTLTERVAALDRLMEAKFVTFDVMVSSQAEKVLLALNAADKAVSKAETATEKRFEAVNEFRGQLADQASTLVSRTEFITKSDALGEKLSDLTDRLNRSEGSEKGKERMVDTRQQSNSNIIGIISVIAGVIGAVVGGIVSFIVKGNP